MTEQTKALAPIDEIRKTLESTTMQNQIKMALPSHIPVEKFTRVVVTAAQLDPRLASTADRRSFYGACLQAAADGLLPDRREGVITTFGDKATWLPMVAGICKKARNSGEIKTLNAKVVYMNDVYESWTDETGEHFKHTPARGERGVPRLTYAYAITKDGGFYFEELDEVQIAAIEKTSRAGTSGPWKGPFKDEMRRKSAIRRLCKYRLPSSTDLDQVIERDDVLFEDMDKPKAEAPAPETSSRLSKIIKEKTAEKEPEKRDPVAVKEQLTPETPEPNEDPNVDELPI